MRVILDTNVWVSGLLWGGSPRRVIELADDAIVVAVAVAMSADAIITGDDDLLVLEQFDQIPILTPAAFIEQYFPG